MLLIQHREDLTGITLNTLGFHCSYILYVSAVDQAASLDDRRTSMAIVEVRVDGTPEDQPKAEKPDNPVKPDPVENLKSEINEEETEQALNGETEEFLKEAKRRVSAVSRIQGLSYNFGPS